MQQTTGNRQPTTNNILLTIDVEDWFQVENFKPWISYSSWSSRELRVEKNTHKLLDLFDSIKLDNQINTSNSTNPKATFFILGWIAEQLPSLVREIHKRGHEVASHGYNHHLCNKVPEHELKTDLSDSRKLLEDISGSQVMGYRAPSFSISDKALETIEESGYFYDSSFNSFDMNKRYGQVDFSQNKKNGIAVEISKTFYELPVSNFKFGNRFVPLGGGGYFRLIPFPVFKLGIQSLLNQEKTYLFYMHPWEFDPEQPRVNEASRFFKFRHYINLKKTYSKLSELIESFNHCSFITCSQYLDFIKAGKEE